MRAPLFSDSQSLEQLWVSLSTHCHSSIDGCFSTLSQRGHNLLYSNFSPKSPYKQLLSSWQLPPWNAAAGRARETNWAPAWQALAPQSCSCCTGKPWNSQASTALLCKIKHSPGNQQKKYPAVKISRLSYLLPPGKGMDALRAQGSVLLSADSLHENLPLCKVCQLQYLFGKLPTPRPCLLLQEKH